MGKVQDVSERKHPAIEITNPNYNDLINVYVSYTDEFIRILQKTQKLIVVEGIKKYLKTWEAAETTSNKIFVHSKTLFSLFSELNQRGRQPYLSGNFKVTLIRNFKELLNDVLGFSVVIPYIEKEKKFWQNLAESFVKHKEFKDFIQLAKFKLNVQCFRIELFSKWSDLDEFRRWLLYHWSKLEVNDDSYLGLVLSNSNFLNFEAQLWDLAFEVDLDIKKIEDRISILNSIKVGPPGSYVVKLRAIEDPQTKLKILTGITEEEKIEIIKTFGEVIAKHDENAIKKILNITFPEFYNYYYNLPLDDEFLVKYFKCYLKAKILNCYTDELMAISDELKKFNLFKYPTRNSILEKYSETNKILIIDGMGIEWLGLIVSLLEKLGYHYEVSITRVNLPSTTEFNRLDGALRIDDLDQTYHKIHYDYAKLILEEITVICKFVEKLSELMKENSEIIITSDHGSTRFSGWPEERIMIDEEVNVERQGRYVVADSGKYSEAEDFTVEHYKDKVFIISKTHKVFKGGSKVTYGEVHGGATPEEALVPVIFIKKEVETFKQEVTVTVHDEEVLYINPVIKIEFSAKVTDVTVRTQRSTGYAKKLTDFQWEVDLSKLKLKPGKHEIEVCFKTPGLLTRSEKIIVNIKSGLEEEDLFGGGSE